MVISSRIASIRSYHWLLAISLAFLAHIVLLIQYPIDTSEVSQKGSVQQAVVISLKSIKALPPAKTVTQATPAPDVTPQKSEPVRQKSKPIKKPIRAPKLTEKKRVILAPPPAVIKPAKRTEITSESSSRESSSTQVVDDERSDSFPTGISETELNDLKLKYQTKLAAWLAKHKRYPKLAKRRKQQGVVKVKFQIDAEGKLLSHQLLERSSYDSLNKEVERMLKRASPMPPIPPALRTEGNQYTYTIPVRFELNVIN
jgi:protein TonB